MLSRKGRRNAGDHDTNKDAARKQRKTNIVVLQQLTSLESKWAFLRLVVTAHEAHNRDGDEVVENTTNENSDSKPDDSGNQIEPTRNRLVNPERTRDATEQGDDKETRSDSTVVIVLDLIKNRERPHAVENQHENKGNEKRPQTTTGTVLNHLKNSTHCEPPHKL